jgi:phosphatidate cytidylyltransferase
MLLFLFILFSVWISDSAAYFIGKSFGKHKLAPRVSPKKTWEGAVAGFVGGAGGFLLLSLFFLSSLPIMDSIVIGVIIGTVGQIGDLAESQLKRDAGVKDSSALIPGHGGILDRFDSLLFIMPVVALYLLITLLW